MIKERVAFYLDKLDETKEYSENYRSDPAMKLGIENANLVSSLSLKDNKNNTIFNFEEGNVKDYDDLIHYPVVDMDYPVYAVPSKTPGHTHLYIEKQLTWGQYRKLLFTMCDIGLIQKGWYNSAMKYKASMLRKESYQKLRDLKTSFKTKEESEDTPA